MSSAPMPKNSAVNDPGACEDPLRYRTKPRKVKSLSYASWLGMVFLLPSVAALTKMLIPWEAPIEVSAMNDYHGRTVFDRGNVHVAGAMTVSAHLWDIPVAATVCLVIGHLALIAGSLWTMTRILWAFRYALDPQFSTEHGIRLLRGCYWIMSATFALYLLGVNIGSGIIIAGFHGGGELSLGNSYSMASAIWTIGGVFGFLTAVRQILVTLHHTQQETEGLV